MQHDATTSAATAGVVTLTGIRESALSVDEVVDAVRHPSCGAVTVFLGVVRDHDRGQGVSSLDYSVHPSAEERLREVAELVAGRHSARLAAVHRAGHLAVGELAVVVVAASAHRDEAFTACRDLIDTLKAEVPIWKQQELGDGGTEWVGMP